MTLRGGLRDRMLRHSVGEHIREELAALGWFDSGRQHRPLNIVDGFPTAEVPINTLAFSTNMAYGMSFEMGSRAEEHLTAMFVDIFAESDALGLELVGDIYAFLKENPHLPVYDYRDDEPRTPVFYVEVMDDVEKRQPANASNNWQRNWYVCAFTLEDMRSNVEVSS